MSLNLNLLVVTIVSFSNLWGECDADVFSAMFKMEHLLDTRQRVIHQLDDYIHKEENRLRELKMYSTMYKSEHERAMKDMTHYTGNPINAFILIKRLTSDLDDIEKRTNKTTEFVSVRNVSEDDNNVTILYPTAVDLQGAALALKRLQRTYKLKVEDLARGVLNGSIYRQPLTASDCHELGVIMLEKKDYLNALAWQMEALRKYKLEDSIPHSITEVDIMDSIATLYHNLGDIVTAMEWMLKVLQSDPDNAKAQEKFLDYDDILLEEEETRFGEPKADTDENANTDGKNKTDAGVNGDVDALTDIKAHNETDTKNEIELRDEDNEGHDADCDADGTNATNMTDTKNLADASVLDGTETINNADKDKSDSTTDVAQTKDVIDNNVEKIDNSISSRNETSAETHDKDGISSSNGPLTEEQYRNYLNSAIELRKEDVIYEGLCRGEYTVAPEISSRLTCNYLNDKPFLKLAPIKVEQQYIDPDIVLFHDVISDEEIAHVIEMATPELERAMVGNLYTYSRVSDFRVGEVAWLLDSQSDVIARLSQRVSDFTGLSMKYSEPFQVSTYGVGGHFAPHYDPNLELIQMEPIASHRIATAMFYLSDVTQGGATVFPKLGLSVFPVKGSAVFWMNMVPSGNGDLNSKHAACPVLEGSKWVSNKWIRQYGQEFLRPCNLENQTGDRKRPAPVLKPEVLQTSN